MFNVDSYIEENKDRMKFSYSKKNRKIDIELADSHSSLSIIKLYNSNTLISFIEDKITQDGNNFYHKVFGENLRESILKETRSGSIRFLSFSNKVVFLFREVFEPVSWFYKPNETLPEQKKININKERTENDLFREKTVGKILFEKLAKSYPTYQVFSDEFKIPYFNVKNMLQKSKFEYNGKTEIRYISMPSSCCFFLKTSAILVSVSSVKMAPVGLLGEFTSTAAVFSVIAFSNSSMFT